MSDGTGISWAQNADGSPGATWNPVVGCEVLSPGCKRCYAMRAAHRHAAQTAALVAAGRVAQPSIYAGLTQETPAGAVWTGELREAREDTLTAPLRWKKPRCVFVNSMGDLHLAPIAWRDRVYGVMAMATRHTFIVLTKRSEAMRDYLADPETPKRIGMKPAGWPLPNVWHGVSCEDQQRADERVPHLLATPSAMRLVSAEPLLGEIDFTRLREFTGMPIVNALRGIVTRGDYLARSPSECSMNTSTQISPPELPRLDWIIAGGESGDGFRPLNLDRARGVRDQCAAAGVKFWFKQVGGHRPDDGGAMLDGRTHHDRPPLYGQQESLI